MSVGYSVEQWQERTEGGRRKKIAAKWTPREVSFVAVAADPNAHTRSNDPPPPNRASARQTRDYVLKAGGTSEFADDMIDRGATLDQVRAALFDDMLARGRLPIRASVHTDFTAPESQTRALADALYARLSGTAPPGPAREHMHRSLLDMMAHHAQVTGLHLRSQSPADVYSAVMHTREGGGMLGSSDFPQLLAGTLDRRLGALFTAAQSGASAIVATGRGT